MLLFLIILALVGCQEIFGAPIAETESLDLDRILSLDHKANLRQRYLPPFLGKKQLSAWEQLVAQEREPSTKETEGTQGNEEKRGLNVKLPENVASLPPFFQDRDLRPYSFGFNYGVNKGTKKKERKKKKKNCGKNMYMIKIANIEPDLIMESTKAPKATMALMAPMAPKKKKDCGKNLYMVKIANIEPDLIMESTKAPKATMALMAPMAPKKKKDCGKNLYMVKIANIEPDLIMEATKAPNAPMAMMAPMAPKETQWAMGHGRRGAKMIKILKSICVMMTRRETV